jgi:hypothetical protein
MWALIARPRGDYYNKDVDGGSEDPADPDKTKRIGTLMLAEDY